MRTCDNGRTWFWFPLSLVQCLGKGLVFVYLFIHSFICSLFEQSNIKNYPQNQNCQWFKDQWIIKSRPINLCSLSPRSIMLKVLQASYFWIGISGMRQCHSLWSKCDSQLLAPIVFWLFISKDCVSRWVL